uniref:Uncharacterized protein n=2 Tax=Oryza TaxID=4527 RepID=A0A0D3F8A4_9ORYZ
MEVVTLCTESNPVAIVLQHLKCSTMLSQVDFFSGMLNYITGLFESTPSLRARQGRRRGTRSTYPSYRKIVTIGCIGGEKSNHLSQLMETREGVEITD